MPPSVDHVLPPDFDCRSRFLQAAGLRWHYVDEGPGETLLMLHGNPTWSYLYRHLIAGLRDAYRCVAPDLPGFGLSEKPPGADYDLRVQAQRLVAFVDALGLKRVSLILHDIGGIVGLHWAAHHKARVRRLIILNTRAAVPTVWNPGARYRAPWSYLALWPLRLPGLGELLVQGLDSLQRVVMPLAFVDRRRFSRAARAGFRFPYRGWAARRAQLATVRQIPIWKSDPVYRLLEETGRLLEGWGVPVQVIWGLRDPSFPPPLIDEMERLFPNHLATVRLPGAGHFLTEEEPESILATVRYFLSRT